jgi:chromosome segregation ATPase
MLLSKKGMDLDARRLMESESYPGPPASSPVPSTTGSDTTLRPRDLEDIRHILNEIRDRGDALLDSQRSTNRDNTELNDKLQRLEDQQTELMRYMRGLNESFERDVQAQLRGVSAQVDQLRNDIGTIVGRPQG